MVQMFATVKNTFVHVDAADQDLSESSSSSRQRASSAPARATVAVRSLNQDAFEEDTEKNNERAFGELSQPSLEKSSLQQHGLMSMHEDSRPSRFHVDVEGMVAKEDDANAPLDRFLVQPNNGINSTTRYGTADGMVPYFFWHGLTHGAHVSTEHIRVCQAQSQSCLTTASVNLVEPAPRMRSSTFPMSLHEEQMQSYRESSVMNAHAAVLLNVTYDEAQGAESRTTVLLRNLPLSYKSSKLMRMIESEGFANMYDFIYVPINFGTHSSVGYAFVNLVDSSVAQRFREAFHGYSSWSTGSKNVCRALWATQHQGLQANIDHYRNSSVMSENVPNEYKPRIFQNGVELTFPPPVRMPRKPKSAKNFVRSRKSYNYD
eukprot:TRINITY_DN11080_c0_g2_i1.p1 TRINITY_DN11080_c0_g2~~TRINITY_DN11080_c0_g2_i1.p1  ORF type:complete len:396 (-),score=44.92 TRINITY_DN11080_c0_g2_i1:300-1424(-)